MSRLHSFSEFLSVLLGTLLSCVFFVACDGGGGGHGGGGGGGGGQNLPQVTITSPNGTATDVGKSIAGITATVTNDPTNAGVTWSVVGVGTLSNITTTSVTYNAPPAGGGLACPDQDLVHATSNANSSVSTNLTITAHCLPEISSISLPDGTVGAQYSGAVDANMGTGPYTWDFPASPLPPGLSSSPNATGSQLNITGTPTQAGTFSFNLRVTDSVGGKSGEPMSMTIEPGSATACVLAGEQYALLISAGESLIGSIKIASDGSVTGEYDLDPPASKPTNPITITSGRCSAGTIPNTGFISLTQPITRTFSFAMRGSDLATGEIIETDATNPGAGEIDLQTTPLAFSAGSYAFGLSGPGTISTVMLVGTFCSNSNSSLTFLQADIQNGSYGSSPDFSSSGTGGYSSLDSYGRFTTGTTPFSLSDGASADLTFYAVGGGKALAAITSGTDNSGNMLPAMVGEVTGQAGSACPQQAGSFSNNSLSASVFNLKPYEPGVAEVGLVNNVNPSLGTLTVTADLNSGGASSIISDQSAAYSISGAGRGTLTFTNPQGQQSQTIFYLDGLGNAYLLGELVGTGSFGVAMSQGTNAVPMTGTYASGQESIPSLSVANGSNTLPPVTQVALDATALTLTDQTTGGSSGTYIADTNNPGRYTATLDNTVTFGDTSIVFYVVDANKIVAMGLTSATPSLLNLLH